MNHIQQAVAEVIASAQRIAPPPSDGVQLIRADTLTPNPVHWLWPGWLALGKLAILAGAPGTGKTTIAVNMAATVTTGTHWPDGTRSPAGDVLIWSGEDDPSDTLLPRLIAAGADKRRVCFVGDVLEDGLKRPFDPATDTAKLLRKAKELPALRLIIVDPVVSAVAGDSHKNTEVRRALQPLVDFAAHSGAALLGITHFSKGGQGQDPSQRVTGSIAFTAVARVVLVAAKTKDDEGTEKRILARSKSNLGPDDGGFSYTLEQCEALPEIFASRVRWGEAVAGSARDLLAEPEMDEDKKTDGNEAMQFLREQLALGTCPAKTIFSEALEAGISRKTLRTAAERLGVVKRKGGMEGGWYWSLPTGTCTEDAHEEAQDAQ